MPCKFSHTPESFGYCSMWEGARGMTAMPAVGNICEYCLHNVDEDRVFHD